MDSPRKTARALVADLPAEYRYVVEDQGIEPAKVTFKEDEVDGSTRLTLIYSIALPAPLADPDLPGADRWIRLLESGGSQTQARLRGSDLLHADVEYAGNLVEYWREELEEETRLFAFLPRYFTARQARDVYSAFWGYKQDADGFATWSGIGQNKEGVYSDHIADRPDLSDGALQSELEAALSKADSTVNGSGRGGMLGTVGAALLSKSASDGAVGLSPGSAVGSAPDEALLPLTVAASLVAYQRKRRGPKPSWYERKRAKPFVTRLERLYAPRAVWVFPPQV
jgi:hypothetical protein